MVNNMYWKNIEKYKGMTKFNAVFEFLHQIGFVFREKKKDYAKGKYWPFWGTGSSSLHVLDNDFLFYCNDKDKNLIVNAGIRCKISDNSIDAARPYGFEHISGNVFWHIIICLMQNEDYFKDDIISLKERRDAYKKLSFSKKYSLNILTRLDRKTFREDFVYELLEVINICFGKTLLIDQLVPLDYELNTYGSELVNIIMASTGSEILYSKSVWSEDVAKMIFDIYHPEILFDKVVNEPGNIGGATANVSIDNNGSNVIEHQEPGSNHYNKTMIQIDKISKLDFEFEHSADSDLIDEISTSTCLQETKFEYIGSPKEKIDKVVINGHKTYPRDRQTAINALVHANYECEIDRSHPSFIRKKTNLNYTEPHHLVPLAFSDLFDVSLDVEENIVSLCSNCHNQIHYGANTDDLLKKLYDSRNDLLKRVGIDITFNCLQKMYSD